MTASDNVNSVSSEPKEASAPRTGRATPFDLLWRSALLLLAVAAPIFLIFYLVPETNDYNLASRLKHHRLASLQSKKIVLIGGSNLAYGIDSLLITRATGCPVVNMGMNGYLGARFMFDEAAPDLQRGDIVVVALEYDNFYKPVDGTPRDQLGVVKANPAILDRLPPHLLARIAWAIPYAAQQKVLRLAGDFFAPQPHDPLDDIETVKGFNADGDLISHIGRKWPHRRENGLDASHMPMDSQVVTLFQKFSEQMGERGVHVMISYTPVIRYYYDGHREALDHLGEVIAHTPHIVAPSRPRDFVYDSDDFFDTVYHLNAQGRPLRTARLVDDLYHAFGKGAGCNGNLYASKGDKSRDRR